jgi:hypothetical protein
MRAEGQTLCAGDGDGTAKPPSGLRPNQSGYHKTGAEPEPFIATHSNAKPGQRAHRRKTFAEPRGHDTASAIASGPEAIRARL